MDTVRCRGCRGHSTPITCSLSLKLSDAIILSSQWRPWAGGEWRSLPDEIGSSAQEPLAAETPRRPGVVWHFLVLSSPSWVYGLLAWSAGQDCFSSTGLGSGEMDGLFPLCFVGLQGLPFAPQILLLWVFSGPEHD